MPITSVPVGGWDQDSYYLATRATRVQIKTYLGNNGVDVQRVREFIVGDVHDAPDNGDTARCTRVSFTVADGFRIIEIDWRLMARWGDRIVALVNGAPNTHLLSHAETLARLAAATVVECEAV